MSVSDDALRRRQVTVAGHQGDVATARSGLSDDASVVRLSALGALSRIDALEPTDLEVALGDPSAAVRRRAAELAASFPEIPLEAALRDPDPGVVEMAAWSAGEREDPRLVPLLMAISDRTSGHADPLCREAAIAALGAIGDQSALEAVVAALDDKPAVRRRAAVALAAFDGPEAEDGLRRCLTDRDWQVRQVAEDLLDLELTAHEDDLEDDQPVQSEPER